MIKNPVPWPNGKRCAVAITFDMDSDSILHLDYPDSADNRITTFSWLQYDKVAIPRILDIFKQYDIKQTFFVPAWCIEQYPETVELIQEAGHEIAHHGYLHEHPNTLTKEEERYWLQRSIDVIKNFTGRRPVGYRAPSYKFSKHTADLLAEEGILYDSSLMGDDVPYVLNTKKGKVLELPTDVSMDDWSHNTHNVELGRVNTIKSPDQAMEVYLSHFDAMWEYGGLWVSVWHPFVTGRLPRAMTIPKMIEYMQEKGDVWFATLEEITAHVQKCIDDGTYKPRVDELPYYDGKIRELW